MSGYSEYDPSQEAKWDRELRTEIERLRVLLDQRLFVLDPDQYDSFAKALDNPPSAGPKLKALMKRRNEEMK